MSTVCPIVPKNRVFTSPSTNQPFDETPSYLPPGVPSRYNQGKISIPQLQELEFQQRQAQLAYRRVQFRRSCC